LLIDASCSYRALALQASVRVPVPDIFPLETQNSLLLLIERLTTFLNLTYIAP